MGDDAFLGRTGADFELEQVEDVGRMSEGEELQRYFQEPCGMEQCLEDVSVSHLEVDDRQHRDKEKGEDSKLMGCDGNAAASGSGDEDDGEKADVMEMLDLQHGDGDIDDKIYATAANAAAEEREEGEVEEDLAKCINARHVQAPVETAEGSGTEAETENESESSSDNSDAEEDDDTDLRETMADSDPLSSSSSDEEDWRAPLRQSSTTFNGQSNEARESKRKPKTCSSDEEDDDKPPRTKNEVVTLPPVPKIEVELQPHHALIPVGMVSSIMGVRIIVEGDDKHSALDEGSILWLLDRRIPLGFVDEVFGPVKKPFYVLRFNDVQDIPPEAQETVGVGYVPDFASPVLNKPDLFKKGYDASGLHDEELSEDEVEFSDDEKEAEYKREKARAKRAGQEVQGESLQRRAREDREKNSWPSVRRDNRNDAFVTRKGNRPPHESVRNPCYGQAASRERSNGRHTSNTHESSVQQHSAPECMIVGPPTAYWPGQQFVQNQMPFLPHYQPVGQPIGLALQPGQFQSFQGQPREYSGVQGGMMVPAYSAGFVPNPTWWPTGPRVQFMQPVQIQQPYVPSEPTLPTERNRDSNAVG